ASRVSSGQPAEGIAPVPALVQAPLAVAQAVRTCVGKPAGAVAFGLTEQGVAVPPQHKVELKLWAVGQLPSQTPILLYPQVGEKDDQIVLLLIAPHQVLDESARRQKAKAEEPFVKRADRVLNHGHAEHPDAQPRPLDGEAFAPAGGAAPQ